MPVSVHCPLCQTEFEVDEEELDSPGCCPACEGYFVFTQLSETGTRASSEDIDKTGRAIPVAQPEPVQSKSLNEKLAETDTTEIPITRAKTDKASSAAPVADPEPDEIEPEEPLPIAAAVDSNEIGSAGDGDEEKEFDLPVAEPWTEPEPADEEDLVEDGDDPTPQIELYDTSIDLDIDLDFDADNIDDQDESGDAAGQEPEHHELAKPLETISPTSEMEVLQPGTQIAGFEIGPLLGSGSMGQVYLAKQISMQRDVALKILPVRIMKKDQEAVDNFMNEVRLLAKLDHPNIVTAFEAGNDKGTYYLAMTYINGESLEQRQHREPVIPETEALAICLNIAQALEYAWTRYKVLHRDIKPANIMIDGMGVVRLMDLGIAKMSSDDEGQPAFVMGTPYYMSPEQATARPNLDWRSDQYSLGATLYHLLTGRVPFPGDNSVDIMTKQAYEKLVPPRELNADISDGTNKLIRKMMAKNPDNRFQEWSEVTVSIEKLIDALKNRSRKRRERQKQESKNKGERQRRKRSKPQLKAPKRSGGARKRRPTVPPRKGPGLVAYLGGFALLLVVFYLLLAIINKADGLHPYRLPQGLFPPGLRPNSVSRPLAPRIHPSWRRQ